MSAPAELVGKAEYVPTVPLLRLTSKVHWCGALRWSDEWNPLRTTEFRQLSDIRSTYGRPGVGSSHSQLSKALIRQII